jgi:tetratricopeptide (TPR) repeat protein
MKPNSLKSRNSRQSVNRIFLLKMVILSIFAAVAGWQLAIYTRANGKINIDYLKTKEIPPLPESNFGPSNARTIDGKLIQAEHFFPAARCAECHQETHAQWSESLHRNAGREPFYKESVNILEKQRGIEFTRHCESCHSPVALLSGALTTGSKVSRNMDDEGVTCSVCHSITETRLDGTGSYTIRRPALLLDTDGAPNYENVTNEQILRDIPSHKKAVMNNVLKTPEFCASCHKAAAPPELNGYKFLRGFNTYDEWQVSGASTDTITPYYRRDTRADCRTCHMPPAGEGKPDLAADKNGMVSSHRFIGANTAAPLFYNQKKQVEMTTEFLQKGVLSADIFAVRNEATGESYKALSQNAETKMLLPEGQEITAEVVVFNRRAAHSFPPELRDLYEPWVEFEATNDQGNSIYHSGFIKPDQTLDEKAHVYKSILLNADSKMVTRHQMWLTAIKAYDNFIPSGRGDIVRYRFRLPVGVSAVTLKATVNYRRFIQDYTKFVLDKYEAMHLNIPVTKMVETKVVLQNGKQFENDPKKTEDSAFNEQTARRWNDYGISLLEQLQASEAAAAFRTAMNYDPKNPDYPTSAAIAEMRMERYAFDERIQLDKGSELLETALRLSPKFSRALFYKALVLRAGSKNTDAEKILSSLVKEHPRDREIWRQLGLTQYGIMKIGAAKKSFESIIEIDPTDANAWQFLEPIYASENDPEKSETAHRNYLLWRDDPVAETVASNFFKLNPNWMELRNPVHFYGEDSLLRPIAAGSGAAPDR